MTIETSDSKKQDRVLTIALFALLLIVAITDFGSLAVQNLHNVRFGQQLFAAHPNSETIACLPPSLSDTEASVAQTTLATDDPLLYGPRIAQYYQRQGRQDLADEWWTALADCNRCLATVWYERGLAAQAAGDADTALHAYEQSASFPVEACDTVGSSDALYLYGSIVTTLHEDDWQSVALSAYVEAVERADFTDYEAYIESRYHIGRMLFLLRRDQESESVLVDLLEERPAHTFANLLLGRVYARSEDQRDLARYYLTQAVETSTPSVWRPMYYLALYELDNGNADEAIDWLEQARERNPNDARILDALDQARETGASE